MKLHLLIACLIAIISIPCSFGQSLSPSEREELLDKLEILEEKVDGLRVGIRVQAIERFKEASVSEKTAFDFYLDCNKILKFDKKRASEYRDWREKTENKLKKKGPMLAFQYQLKYLILSLRYAEGVELSVLMPEIEALVDQIVKNVDTLENQGYQITKEGINETVFAKAYKLDQSLQVSDWCFNPGDYNQMFQKIIFPYYRQTSIQSLPALWDKRIKLETFHIETIHKDDELKLDKFETETLPKLYWRKSVDLYKHGFEESAANTMAGIIAKMPESPLAKDRIIEFKALLTGEWDREEESTEEEEETKEF